MDVVVAGLTSSPGKASKKSVLSLQSRALYERVTRDGTISAADVVRRLGLDPNAEPLEIIDPPATRHCAWCGQRHERGSGQCACWSEK